MLKKSISSFCYWHWSNFIHVSVNIKIIQFMIHLLWWTNWSFRIFWFCIQNHEVLSLRHICWLFAINFDYHTWSRVYELMLLVFLRDFVVLWLFQQIRIFKTQIYIFWFFGVSCCCCVIICNVARVLISVLN